MSEFDVNEMAMVEYNLGDSIIANYVDEKKAEVLMKRLMMFHPAARECGESAMLAAAQLAIVVGANPMPSTNEIHIWKNKKNGQVSVTLGINFFRRRANELAGVYWTDTPRVMTKQEREEYQIPQGLLAAIAKGARKSHVYEDMQHGVPWEDSVKLNTRVGIGTVPSGWEPKAGRPPIWTALKGAEIDALRNLVPMFELAQPKDWLDIVPEATGEIVEGSVVERENLAALQQATASGQVINSSNAAKVLEQNAALLHGEGELIIDAPVEPQPTQDEKDIPPGPIQGCDGDCFICGAINTCDDTMLPQDCDGDCFTCDEADTCDKPASQTTVEIDAETQVAIEAASAEYEAQAQAQQEETPTQREVENNGNWAESAGGIRQELRKDAGWIDGTMKPKDVPLASPAQAKALKGLLSKLCQDEKEWGKVLDFIFQVSTPEELSKIEASKLIQRWKKSDSWDTTTDAPVEVGKILNFCAIRDGQTQLFGNQVAPEEPVNQKKAGASFETEAPQQPGLF